MKVKKLLHDSSVIPKLKYGIATWMISERRKSRMKEVELSYQMRAGLTGETGGNIHKFVHGAALIWMW